MFTKKEFFGAIVISLIGGISIGYSKARENCLEAIVRVTDRKDEKTEKETEP